MVQQKYIEIKQRNIRASLTIVLITHKKMYTYFSIERRTYYCYYAGYDYSPRKNDYNFEDVVRFNISEILYVMIGTFT